MIVETLEEYGHSNLPNYVIPTLIANKCEDDVVRIAKSLTGALPVEIPYMPLTEKGMLSVGNGVQKFRMDWTETAYGDGPDPLEWDVTWTNQGSGFIKKRGDAFGASYMCLSLCPLARNTSVVMQSKRTFAMPLKFSSAYSMSQRASGFCAFVGFAGVNPTTLETEYLSNVADVGLSASATATSTITTFTTATAHGLKNGDRVTILQCADSRLNFDQLLVTVIDATSFSVAATPGAGTYNSTGGTVRYHDPMFFIKNAVGYYHDSTNVTSSTSNFAASRRNNSFRVQGFTLTTTAGNSNAMPYSDGYTAAAKYEMIISEEDVSFVSSTTNSSTAPSSVKIQTRVADEGKRYKLLAAVKQSSALTAPIARITAISKSGTTTATVTTDVPHGLTTSDFIQIYGVRDITNFPALTAATAVASVIDANNFTVVMTGAVTASSAGGAVWQVNGGTLAVNAIPQSVQSISRTNNVMTLIGNTTWATPVVGETMHLYGCDATSMGLYDGAYRVLRVSTTTLELESVGPDFASINCGGNVIRRLELRLDSIVAIEFARLIAEIANQNGLQDVQKSIPVNVTAGTVTTVATVTSVTAANNAPPLLVADVASAAITTTATTTAVTPASGSAYSVEISVTAASGTNRTMDVSVEESDDSGTNWYKVYDFPRITATGAYRSPVLKLRGNRVRYVQTIGGSSPSFTRVVNRLQSSASTSMYVQLVDNTAALLNTTGNATGAILAEGCEKFNLVVRCASQSAAATVDIQASEDGTNWVTIAGGTVTTIAGIVRSSVSNVHAKFVRAFVTAQGTTVVMSDLMLKGKE